MLYVIGFLDVLEALFVRYFRIVAGAFVFIYAYGLVGGLDRGSIKISDLPSYMFPVICVLVVLALIYEILTLKAERRNREGRKHNGKHYR